MKVELKSRPPLHHSAKTTTFIKCGSGVPFSLSQIQCAQLIVGSVFCSILRASQPSLLRFQTFFHNEMDATNCWQLSVCQKS
ncbi:hypothetical protein OUZ56_010139 [Daphnia magna]|uniref:Uncharacterized protein n=1 Tax=Daphnia magna TaxID=35525 RepID=A0ABR0AIB8_9CRUS|nr:hypothetical protein OUZ56_010139 [Daphnia magna]